MKKHLALTIHGKVQGVFYRHHTTVKAKELGLAGWVKNNPDGTVSIEAEGDEAALKQLLYWCHTGSPAAKVDSVEAEWKDKVEGWEGFGVRRA